MVTTATKDLGEACITNASCLSNRCEGVCVDPKLGDPCSMTFGCQGGLQCEPTTLRCRPDANTPAVYTGFCQQDFRQCRFDEYCGPGKKCIMKRSVGMQCDRLYECGDGLMCWGGLCTPRCISNGDCPAGFHCSNKLCKGKPASPVASPTTRAPSSSPAAYPPYMWAAAIGGIVLLMLVVLVPCLVKRCRGGRTGKSDGPAHLLPAGPTGTIAGPSAPRKESSAGFESSPAPIPDDQPPAYEAIAGYASPQLRSSKQ
jgi:hypothetical protein